MIKTFILSFKLKIAYLVNSIIFSIKQLPIIGKMLPDKTLYSSKGIKILATIIASLLEIIGTFIGKLFYILFMIFSVLSIYKTPLEDTFLHIFVFLTIIGAMLNTYMFNPSKDKYYAMFVMRMDAKKYTLSNYFYSILKVIIGFMPFTIIFGFISNVNLIYLVILPFFIASIKMIFNLYFLNLYNKKKVIVNENKPVKHIWIFTAILLVIAYGLPYIGIVINQLSFIIISILAIVIAIFSIKYLFKYEKYRELYKKILNPAELNYSNNANDIVKQNVQKQIKYGEDIKSNKKGYAYFNDLFVKRHRSILMSSAKKIAAVSFFIIIAAISISMVREDIKKILNEITLNFLPYFVFIMYIINRGQVVTQAMFMNCDHSMLTYSFYRKPKAILGLFKERLKSVILINLFPAIVIGVGLALILYVTGGTDNIYNYYVLIVSIASMSIFFSVHYLVMYYCMQPYNYNSEIKDSRYKIVSAITYIVCYFTLQLKLPTFYFGVFTVCFSIIYCLASLLIAYRIAPKTFKIKV